jgi:hypothetical protein
MEKKKLNLKLLELENPKEHFSISTYSKNITHASKINKININDKNNNVINNENENKKNLITVDNGKYKISEKKKKELKAFLDPNNILYNDQYFNPNFKKDFLKKRRETMKTQTTQTVGDESNKVTNNDLKTSTNKMVNKLEFLNNQNYDNNDKGIKTTIGKNVRVFTSHFDDWKKNHEYKQPELKIQTNINNNI